ncbi:MAG: response regulator [Hyphomonadaceae bacterium]
MTGIFVSHPIPIDRNAGHLVFVDDDAAVLNALRFAFETEGYVVHACRDGQSLLDAPPLERRTCLILDEGLRGGSGLDLLMRLRTCGVTAPAILIATHPRDATRRRAAEAGVEIVEKPLLGDLLARKVRQALSDGPLR